MLREPAPAKVNLFLHVGDKRGDGYHDLTSLAVFPAIGDALFVEPHHNLALAVDGPMVRGLPVDSSNLALNAAHALRHQALAMGRPVGGAAMTLTKNLPVASGIGGGSADAAAALRLLNKLWRLDLPNETLEIIALTLGSDVPVCVASIPRWMEGRGERLSAAPALPQFWLTLVNPGVAVATADVFRTLTERRGAARPEAPAGFASAHDLAAWLDATTRNDLEAPAMRIAPAISDALAGLRAQEGCLLARMSGSGATCFGLFAMEDAAARAAAALRPMGWAAHGAVKSG